MDYSNHIKIDGEPYLVENHQPEGMFAIPLEEVAEKLFKDSEVEFMGYWYVKDAPAFVWHSKNPNRELGHKDYVVLKHRYNPMLENNDMVIMGYDQEDMEKLSVKEAAACHNCNTVCWSLTRHDYHACRCKEDDKQIYVDGGSDYMRMSFGNQALYSMVTINFLTKQITKLKREAGEGGKG
jgi:aldehyde:ferredoxin oxidoreductase